MIIFRKTWQWFRCTYKPMKPKGLVKAFRMFEKRGINLIIHGKLSSVKGKNPHFVIFQDTNGFEIKEKS